MIAFLLVVGIISIPFILSFISVESRNKHIRHLHRQVVSSRNIAKSLKMSLAHVKKITKRF